MRSNGFFSISDKSENWVVFWGGERGRLFWVRTVREVLEWFVIGWMNARPMLP